VSSCLITLMEIDPVSETLCHLWDIRQWTTSRNQVILCIIYHQTLHTQSIILCGNRWTADLVCVKSSNRFQHWNQYIPYLFQTQVFPPIIHPFYKIGMISYSSCFLFADDIKTFCEIKSPHDSLLLQMDINCVHGGFISSFMKFKVNNTRVLSFSRKTSFLSFNYKL
jgi:hypothetical protein